MVKFKIIGAFNVPYEQVLAKHQRGQKHIQDFEAAVESFRNANRDSVGKKTDEQTGDVTYFVKSIPVVPMDIGLILGDAFHNLRSTLDHLAHAVVRPTTERAIKDTYFPIGNSAADYRGLANRYIKGVRQPCRDIFDRIQPYKGGGFGHYLWQLHRLDIIDKHRLLLTMSFAPVLRTLTPSEHNKANAKFNKFGNVKFLSVPHWMLTDSMTPDNSAPSVPLQEGQKLMTVTAAESQHDVRFSFSVAIHEPGIVEPTPADLFLRMVSSQVECAINDLAPYATL